MPLPPALAAKLAKRNIISPKQRIQPEKRPVSYEGFEGCPNKYNIYHECTKFCVKRWKFEVVEPTMKYLQRRERLLKKYPLPNNWKEIYDRGCGRFYYWDTDKNLVSWLPPDHPKSHISLSAAYLRKGLISLMALKAERSEIKDRQNQSSGLIKVKIAKDTKKTGSLKSDEAVQIPFGPYSAPAEILATNTETEQYLCS